MRAKQRGGRQAAKGFGVRRIARKHCPRMGSGLLRSFFLPLPVDEASGQELLEILGQRRREMHIIAAVICEGNGLCVEEQSLEPKPPCLFVGIVITIAFIAGDRMASMVQVRTNLVRAACHRRTLQQAVHAIGS